MLFDGGYIEKVAVSWILSEALKATQEELLESHKKEHGKYPAWNVPAQKTCQKPQESCVAYGKSCKTKSRPQTLKSYS